MYPHQPHFHPLAAGPSSLRSPPNSRELRRTRRELTLIPPASARNHLDELRRGTPEPWRRRRLGVPCPRLGLAAGAAQGFALVAAIVAMLMMSALGAALMVITSSETLIAAGFRNRVEALYAADAIADLAVAELGSIADWDALLSGQLRSSFADGAPGGTRTTPGGLTVDLSRTVNVANCGQAVACSPSQIVGNGTGDRPWGADNPVWQLFAYGPLGAVWSERAVDTPFYVLAMVADDPSENDGDPTTDGSGDGNPGAGIISLRAEAFGPQGTHTAVELTVARLLPPQDAQNGETPLGHSDRVRVLFWREIR